MNNTYFTHVNKNNCENCDIDHANKCLAKMKILLKNNDRIKMNCTMIKEERLIKFYKFDRRVRQFINHIITKVQQK